MLEDLADDNATTYHAPPREIIPENGFLGAFREEGFVGDTQSAHFERPRSSPPTTSSPFEIPTVTTVRDSEIVEPPVITGSSGFCLTCGGFFLRLDRHVLTHTGLRPFACKECSGCFRQKGHLVRHVASKHQTSYFTCPYCQKVLTRQDKLKHHMMRTCKALREF